MPDRAAVPNGRFFIGGEMEEVKKQVRILAAEKNMSMADLTRELLLSGLETYEKSQKPAKAQKSA